MTLVGRQVRILTGPAAGLVGTVTGQEQIAPCHCRVEFSPGVNIRGVGNVRAVYRAAMDLECLPVARKRDGEEG
jgi:hypothetical protein